MSFLFRAGLNTSTECLAPAFSANRRQSPASRTSSIRVVYGLERFAAIAIVMVLSPLLAGIAVLLAILSRRSPFVLHTRVGLNGAPLHMLKFRTMWAKGRAGAAWSFVETVSGDVSDLKDSRDSRVTSRFASFCRRHSLDELPQLVHVITGEMSFVGPRPITREELDKHYGSSMDEVLSVRPGMTGLWQVTGRSCLTYARRRRLDLIFVRRATVGLYFLILMRSVPRVLRGAGAC